ncbi:hypothetical protein ACOMHN_011880 [Nucella lapillus]
MKAIKSLKSGPIARSVRKKGRKTKGRKEGKKEGRKEGQIEYPLPTHHTMKLTWTSLQRRLPSFRVILPLLLLLLLMLLLLLHQGERQTPSPPAQSSLRLIEQRSLSRFSPSLGVVVGVGGGGGGRGGGEGGGGRWFNGPNCSVVEFLAGPDPTVLEAYDPQLVCGPSAQDKDVVCSTFFSQIDLRDDDACVRRNDDTKVPRIVYFVIFGTYTFKFWHYVSVMAAKRHVTPSALYVIGDAHPVGYWWQRLMKDCRGVHFIYRPSPSVIGGQPVKFRHHMSDLVRLQALLLNGGLYLDTDMVMVRDPGPLLTHDITMGLIENGTGMGNAFIAAKRNSDFIREWYAKYSNYSNDQFYKNSLHVPRDMWHKHPHRLHMESDRLYRPNWFEADKLFKGWDYDWRQNYAVHVWTNGNPVPNSEEEVQTSNTTIAQVFRNALYGDPAPRWPAHR